MPAGLCRARFLTENGAENVHFPVRNFSNSAPVDMTQSYTDVPQEVIRGVGNSGSRVLKQLLAHL
mgnify:CR=1 FL=1